MADQNAKGDSINVKLGTRVYLSWLIIILN